MYFGMVQIRGNGFKVETHAIETDTAKSCLRGADIYVYLVHRCTYYYPGEKIATCIWPRIYRRFPHVIVRLPRLHSLREAAKSFWAHNANGRRQSSRRVGSMEFLLHTPE